MHQKMKQLAGFQVCQREEESAGAGIAPTWPWMVSGRREERESHRGISKGLMYVVQRPVLSLMRGFMSHPASLKILSNGTKHAHTRSFFFV